jgi:16S rRNA A1518/A1519 N6-dimethyltransferase RsmA/KsgA/DIM1 with predicted DNA glycosylase/AP lyase activity
LDELIGDNLIFNDVLQVDFATSFDFDLSKTLVYGSLPYYITSPIIGKLFLPIVNSPLSGRQGLGRGIFIVQKEFAEKIATDAKKKSYLRWLLNHNHIVTYHKTIPAK